MSRRRGDTASRYLFLQTEPTPYVLGLVKALNTATDGHVDTFFQYENSSQPWNLSLEGYNARILPVGHAANGEIWRAIRSGRYRVAYVAGWGEPTMRFALLAAWFSRLPVVVESDTPLPVGQPLLKRLAKAVIMPLLFRIPAMMLPYGTRQSGYFRHYGVGNERIRVINYTVDVTAIANRCTELGITGRLAARARLGFNVDDIVFIFVGRLYDFKGISVLLDSFVDIAARWPHARLLIVGDGPERERVATAAVNDRRIVATGRLDMAGVTEMYHSADVAVVPSLFEPFGLVVHESMAAGLPVIVTDRVGSSDDLVKEGVTGRVVTAGDATQLTAALSRYCADQKEIGRMGAEAAKLISTWTPANCADRIIKVWDKVGRD